LISGNALNWIYCSRNFNLDREYKMVRKIMVGVCFTLMMTGLTGCGNPHKDAARAAEAASNSEADINKQKAEIVEDYRKCLSKNPSDAAACDGYKQALDAM
jgi:hypothetical protein